MSLDDALQRFVRRYGVAPSDRSHVLRALTCLEDSDADPPLPVGSSATRWAAITICFTAQVPCAVRSYVE